MNPAEIIELAVTEGFKTLAIADHYTVGGLEEAKLVAQRCGCGLSEIAERRQLFISG